MTNTILELTKNFSIASFKPHLNYHECYLSLIINPKLSIPLKMYVICYKVSSYAIIPKKDQLSTLPNGCSILWLSQQHAKFSTNQYSNGMRHASCQILSARFSKNSAISHLLNKQKSIRLTISLISISGKWKH